MISLIEIHILPKTHYNLTILSTFNLLINFIIYFIQYELLAQHKKYEKKTQVKKKACVYKVCHVLIYLFNYVSKFLLNKSHISEYGIYCSMLK